VKRHDVYISGKVVRYLLTRFEESQAIGLVDLCVKAYIPAKTFQKLLKENKLTFNVGGKE